MIAALTALLMVAPPCGAQDVCAYRASLCMSVQYYRLDQRDRAREHRELTDCKADLDGARSEGRAVKTLLTRKAQACEDALQAVKGAALGQESALLSKVARAEAESAERWSAWDVAWLTVGVAVGAGLAGGLVGWLAR